MLHSTKGIVLHSIKFSETSLIVKIYTELFGIQSYLLKGVRSPRSKVRPGLFQPLTLLDLVVYHREKHTLQTVKEIRLAHPYHSIPFDIRKSSVVLFLNELLYQSIREEEPNAGLFEFIWNSCTFLDKTAEPVSGFHLSFAIHLCHHLGIFPNSNYSLQHPFFNLREGIFQASVPDHPHFLDPENSKLFYHLLTTPFLPAEILTATPPPGRGDMRDHDPLGTQTPKVNEGNPEPETRNLKPAARSRLLETVLLYYQLHLPGFKGLQSHHILHTVLS
ncbi:MAG: DNA repair protein RecO [Bacteroidota bacterium]